MGKGRGNWGHKGRPGKVGGSSGSGAKPDREGAVSTMPGLKSAELRPGRASNEERNEARTKGLSLNQLRDRTRGISERQKVQARLQSASASAGAAAAAARAARREITRRPGLQGFNGPTENTIRMVAAERKFRAGELKKTRASVKDAYQKGVAARKLLKPIRVDKDGVPLRPEKAAGIISPSDLGGIKQFDAYVKGLRGEPRLKAKAQAHEIQRQVDRVSNQATPNTDKLFGSYESRIRAAGRGSANRAGNWSGGYGNR